VQVQALCHTRACGSKELQANTKKKKSANIEKQKKIKHESTTMGIVQSTLRDATTPYKERWW